MRRFTLLILSALLFGSAIAQITREFRNTPLTEALLTIEQSQKEYTISVLYDGLSTLRTSAKVKNLSVPDAVKLVCKGLPVKVKVDGQKIYVQQKRVKRETEYKTKVLGYLVDEITGQPVKAKVTIMMAKDGTIFDTLTTKMQTNGYIERSWVTFTISQPGDYIIKCEADGYETTINHWSVNKLYKHEEFVRVTSPWYIRRPKKVRNKDVQLGEVVVKATKVKFYHKGDTVVYNADAFELAEGSMLDALIKQLPGVELKEGGEITVNGRRVDELLLNGKDFLNSDRKAMLENLPSYMVKNIKVFEKTNRMNEIMGDTLRKNLAMDVRLKKEYSTNFVGNIDAGVGTNHTALARAFGLRIAPKSSFTIHANANNVNEARDPGEQGDWSPMQQAMSVYNIYRAGGSYHYANDKIYYANKVHMRYTENKADSYTGSEQFLPTGNTFGRNFNRGRSYGTAFNTEHTFKTEKDIIIGPLNMRFLCINPSFDYSNNRGHSLSGSATTDQDIYGSYGKEWRDTITTPNAGQSLRKYGLNRTKNDIKRNGYTMHAIAKYDVNISPSHDRRFVIGLHGVTDFTNNVNRLYEHYNLDYLQTNVTDFRNRYSYNKSQGLKHEFSFGTRDIPFSIFNIQLNYSYFDKKQMQCRSLYLLNKLDAWGEQTEHALGELPSVDEMLLALDNGNSYWQQEDNYIHSFSPRFRFGNKDDSKISLMVMIQPSFDFSQNRLHYQRGALDTLVCRNYKTTGVDAWFYCVPSGGNWPYPWEVSLNYNIRTRIHDLSYLVDYRDDSNPLNIMLGNPNLRNAHTHEFSLQFTRNMKKQRMFESSVNAHIFERRLAMGYIYDTRTGVRTVTPDNVNGNWDLTGQLSYSARLDKNGKFTYSTNTNATYINSVDLIGTETNPQSSMVNGQSAKRSEVHTTNINETLKLNARFSAKASLNFKADLHWQHSTSGRENFSTINVADFDYGLGGVFQIPLGFQFSTDMTMYSRRGYSDRSMNTNELVWNARLSRTFAKAGITVMLDAFDLFGQLSNVRRTINAQGRTETWSNVTPQYAMLHVLYRLNKKKKE